jgi:hypothetical protein
MASPTTTNTPAPKPRRRIPIVVVRGRVNAVALDNLLRFAAGLDQYARPVTKYHWITRTEKA